MNTNIKWTHQAVDSLTEIVNQLDKLNRPHYSRSLERRILAKIKNLPKDEDGFRSFAIDMCKIDYKNTAKDLRILKVSLLRRIK